MPFGYVVVQYINQKSYYWDLLVHLLIWPQEGPKDEYFGPKWQTRLYGVLTWKNPALDFVGWLACVNPFLCYRMPVAAILDVAQRAPPGVIPTNPQDESVTIGHTLSWP